VVWLEPAISVPIVAALGVTIGLQLWRSNLVLSLAGGTAVHIALATSVAAGLLCQHSKDRTSPARRSASSGSG
jgi:hypothetical protein